MDLNFRNTVKQTRQTINDTRKEIYYARDNLKILQNRVIKLKEYFKEDNIKIRDVILEEFEDETYEYLQVTGNEIKQIQENALQILDANPILIEKLYNKIKDTDIKNLDMKQEEYKVKEGEEKCAEYAIEAMLKQIRTEKINERQKRLLENIRNTQDQFKLKIYKEKMEKIPELKEAYEYMEIMESGSEIEKLKKFVKYKKDSIEKELIESERKSFKLSGKLIKKYGFLEQELKLQNADYASLQMKNMQYELKTEGTENDIGLENIFTDEYLDTIDYEQLTVLNAFWQNRFTKIASGIKQAIFIADNLDLWQMLEENGNIDSISAEKLVKTIFKLNFLDNVSGKIRKNLIKLDSEENSSIMYFDYNKEMPQDFEKEYEEFFDKFLPECNNNLEDDLDCCHSIRNNINIIYDKKNEMIKKLLIQIEHNPKITNWGCIINKNKQKDGYDKNVVLLGFDYPGFNMPLRLHTQKNDIVKYLKTLKSDAVIPIYEGNSDMEYKGKMLTTKVFMPLTQKRESEIVEKNKSTNPADLRYPYIKHLGNLLTRKYKRINKIYPSKYIDLETGEIGTKRNGKFMPESEEKDLLTNYVK